VEPRTIGIGLAALSPTAAAVLLAVASEAPRGGGPARYGVDTELPVGRDGRLVLADGRVLPAALLKCELSELELPADCAAATRRAGAPRARDRVTRAAGSGAR